MKTLMWTLICVLGMFVGFQYYSITKLTATVTINRRTIEVQNATIGVILMNQDNMAQILSKINLGGRI